MASLKIDPRSQFWYACITLPDGRQTQFSTKLRVKEVSRQKALTYADTLEKAYRVKRAEAQFRKLMGEAWLAISGTELARSTPETFFTSWLQRRKHEVSNESHLRYSGFIRDFLSWLGKRAKDDISTISSSDIRAFRDHEAERKSAASANTAIKTLRSAFKDAMRERLISENPAGTEFVSRIKRKNENKKRRGFTIEELRKLLHQAEASEWKGLILTGIYLGQRLGDLVRLTWSNIDLKHSEITISTEKTGRTQIIPIAAPLLKYITEELPAPDDPGAPLFPRAYANLLRLGRVASLSREFHSLLAAAGLVPPEGPHRKTNPEGSKRRRVHPLSFHSLRHTATSLMKSAGVSNAVAMDVIGHESLIISAHYTTIDCEAKRRAINLMPDVFGGSK
jgi:integrase